MTFGDKLRAIRLQNGLSQEQLARRLGTSKQVISRYENNTRSPKLSVAINYAEILGVPSTYFVDEQSPLYYDLVKKEFDAKNGIKLSDTAIQMAIWFESLPPEKQEVVAQLLRTLAGETDKT